MRKNAIKRIPGVENLAIIFHVQAEKRHYTGLSREHSV